MISVMPLPDLAWVSVFQYTAQCSHSLYICRYDSEFQQMTENADNLCTCPAQLSFSHKAERCNLFRPLCENFFKQKYSRLTLIRKPSSYVKNNNTTKTSQLFSQEPGFLLSEQYVSQLLLSSKFIAQLIISILILLSIAIMIKMNSAKRQNIF